METGKIFVSELSAARHTFKGYHFCRGNSNKRKTRIGVILKGSGTYLYLNKRLSVREGDVVFIPENIYCYSEWHGEPDIEVAYVSGFIHYDGFGYEPQTIQCGERTKQDLLRIGELLSLGYLEGFEAYSLFYKVLREIFPQMVQSSIVFDKALQDAIEYITANWNRNFSVCDLAKSCCVSESTLYHLFQKELGQTPIRFLNSIRINIAMEYLENSSYSISTISNMVCFHSENHFRKVFCDFVGTTPLKFKKSRGALKKQ